MARNVKLQSHTSLPIQVFEVEVYSAGNNVAAGKTATQSTTNPNFPAGNAVDRGLTTFSHTAVGDKVAWWKVDLGGMFPIESVKVLNRWCRNSSDPSGCLCRLSHAAVVLYDDRDKWVYSTLIGNMCGVHMTETNLTRSAEYCTSN